MTHGKHTTMNSGLMRLVLVLMIFTGVTMEVDAQGSRSASGTITVSATVVSGFTMPVNGGQQPSASAKMALESSSLDDPGVGFPENPYDTEQATEVNSRDFTGFSFNQSASRFPDELEASDEFDGGSPTKSPTVRSGVLSRSNVPVFIPAFDPATQKKAMVVVFVAN